LKEQAIKVEEETVGYSIHRHTQRGMPDRNTWTQKKNTVITEPKENFFFSSFHSSAVSSLTANCNYTRLFFLFFFFFFFVFPLLICIREEE